MDNANNTPLTNFRRRKVLSYVTFGLPASFFPISTLSNTNESNTDDNFHLHVAMIAKKLVAKRKPSLRILVPRGSEDNITPLVSAFQGIAGIAVDIISTPVDEINTQLLLDSMSGESEYDLALPATFGLPELVASGAIISLTKYARKYEPSGYRDKFLYSIGDTYDSELYGFQTDGDAYTMFYLQEFLEDETNRKRYADKFGIELDVPLTWPELDRQMQFFNRKAEGVYGGLLFRTPGYLAWEWWVRFHAKGYWPFSESLEPQIDSDAGVEALEEMIRATEFLAPETKTLRLFENWERFSKGDVYCNIGWGGTQKYLNSTASNIRGKMRFGPTPGGVVNGKLLLTPYFNWGWNYVVTKDSKQPELSYLFALFASSPAMSTISVRQKNGYFDPFRQEHYNDTEIQNVYSKEFLKVHEQSLQSAIPDLYLANQSQYFTALSDGLAQALSGKLSADKALRKVAQQWNITTSRSDKILQKQRWMNLRQKYPANVAQLLRDISR